MYTLPVDNLWITFLILRKNLQKAKKNGKIKVIKKTYGRQKITS